MNLLTTALCALAVLVACEYSFPVGFDGQVETTFVGLATTPEEIIPDIVAFCTKHLQSTYCSDSNLKIISKHAVDVVKSERLLDELGLKHVCAGTMIGADAVVVAQMAKEVGSMVASASSFEVTKYVEVGSYLGCSTFIVANLTAGSGVLLFAHDIWVENMEELPPGSDPPPLTEDYFHSFYRGVTSRGFARSVIPIRGPSTYTLSIHAAASIDLAFVDGDHSEQGCLSDLRLLWPRMRSGGIVYVHDVLSKDEDDVTRCVQQFMNEVGLDIEMLEMVGQTTFARIKVP